VFTLYLISPNQNAILLLPASLCLVGLVKNTLLGLTVFEVYGSVVEGLAPLLIIHKASTDGLISPSVDSLDTNSNMPRYTFNPYNHTPVSLHILGGFLGGCAHGIAGTLWDATAALLKQQSLRDTAVKNLSFKQFLTPARMLIIEPLPGMMAHHSVAHAVLFGSYEASKRFMFSCCTSNGGTGNGRLEQQNYMEPIDRLEHLASIFLAGGFAGQAQHIVSFFTEFRFLQQAKASWKAQHWSSQIRPLVAAFLSSGIAFVALEYGRSN
jgi:hypothetical protein